MYILKCFQRKKMRFIGQGFSYPEYNQIIFVEDIRNGYAIYPTRFAKIWHSIMPKHLFTERININAN